MCLIKQESDTFKSNKSHIQKGKTFHQRNKSKLKKSHENTTKTSSLIAQKYHKFKLGQQVN